jgi:tripartite ATP-independent transporter DctM subunit
LKPTGGVICAISTTSTTKMPNQNVSIAKLFIAGVIPGLLLGLLFMGYIVGWALLNKDKIPPPEPPSTFGQKLYASRHLIPVVALIGLVLGSIYTGVATATEAAALGVAGSLSLAAVEGSLSWTTFKEGLLSGCRVYCMIGFILAGAAFLTLSMGFIGLPRQVAELIGGLGLSPFGLILLLTGFFILLGCFLDGISMVVLTMAVLLPTVEKAGFDLIAATP